MARQPFQFLWIGYDVASRPVPPIVNCLFLSVSGLCADHQHSECPSAQASVPSSRVSQRWPFDQILFHPYRSCVRKRSKTRGFVRKCRQVPKSDLGCQAGGLPKSPLSVAIGVHTMLQRVHSLPRAAGEMGTSGHHVCHTHLKYLPYHTM